MMKTMKKTGLLGALSPRAMVLGVLGAITLGVALLSVSVSYSILIPHFGGWAAPTVAALDALWVVLQATVIISGTNRPRAARVEWAGLFLTVVIAAIPTADLIQSGPQRLDLAVVLTPVAIVATKLVWWLVMPSLGRQVSPEARRTIADRRQTVADTIEVMEAKAADEEAFLIVAARLAKRRASAETTYRTAVLEAQKDMVAALHEQAEETGKEIEAKPLPASVAAIELPTLEGWEPSAPALPVTTSGTAGTQVNALEGGQNGTSRGTAVTLGEVAFLAGVPVPQPGVSLSDGQLDVLLRFQRHSEHPPSSYRKSRDVLKDAGFKAAEDRVRASWKRVTDKESAMDGENEQAPEEDEAADDESHRTG
ncbi:hypothetical protein [Streptomyces sp. NPDC088785]|uniref:hypothetical protein n=1 Tax=Streptomyces sp. NPDC088785 TaxID=3365897 RepID=UPI00382E7053